MPRFTGQKTGRQSCWKTMCIFEEIRVTEKKIVRRGGRGRERERGKLLGEMV